MHFWIDQSQTSPALPDVQPAEVDLGISGEKPSKKEMRKVINLPKDGKDDGPVSIIFFPWILFRES